MGMLKASDHKAIGWYAQFYGYRMQLSAWPLMRFKDKDGNDVEPVSIEAIVGIYKGQMKEQAKETARLNRGKKKK